MVRLSVNLTTYRGYPKMFICHCEDEACACTLKCVSARKRGNLRDCSRLPTLSEWSRNDSFWTVSKKEEGREPLLDALCQYFTLWQEDKLLIYSFRLGNR